MRLKGLEAWLPEPKERCFFGTDIPEAEKKAWNEGRESLDGWFRKLTLWERIKIAYKGYLLG